MIGLDTNVLVRFLMQDDARQSARAKALIRALSAESPGYVCMAVIVEMVWVLRYVFQLERKEVVSILAHLAQVTTIRLEHAGPFANALRLAEAMNVDFVDCLIAGVGRQAGCQTTISFDAKAARIPGMSRVI